LPLASMSALLHSCAVPKTRRPTQARSQATFDAILEATAALLVERGYSGVNTNAVAERAGVKPPAVYRYFADKNALCRELAARLQAELDVRLDAVLADAAARPLPELVDDVIDAAAAFWFERPAFGALWFGEWAIRGDVNPAQMFGERTVARFVDATPHIVLATPERKSVVLATAMTIGIAVLNIEGANPALSAATVVAETKVAIKAYLIASMTEQ
jgi:AcrR family transcriptional regulator